MKKFLGRVICLVRRKHPWMRYWKTRQDTGMKGWRADVSIVECNRCGKKTWWADLVPPPKGKR